MPALTQKESAKDRDFGFKADRDFGFKALRKIGFK